MSATAILDAPSVKAWPQAKLADVADIVNGGTPKSNVAEFWDGEHQWLTPADMGKMVGREIAQTPRTITAMGLAKSSARLAPPRSVILSTRAPIGHLAINSVPMAFNQGCRALVPGPKLDHVFLYYFLLLSRELLNELGTGTTFKELSATSLKTVQMPLPPVEEQKRIVAVLDQAFAALDRARALAEANLADAEQLFAAAIGEIFRNLGADRSSWMPLSKIAEISYGYTEKATLDPVGPQFLRITDIQDGVVDWSNVPYCQADAGARERYRLESGDIVFARTGATTGKSYLLRSPPDCVFASYLIRLRVDNKIINAEFLSHYFNSDQYWVDVRAGTSGSAQGGFNASKLGAMIVPVPDLSAQSRAAQRLTEIQNTAVALRDSYSSKVTDIADLQKSLLKKAFAGELT